MAYNQELANRIRKILAEADVNVFEKRMFGELSFLIDGKLCVSAAAKDRVLLRLSPADHQEAIEKTALTKCCVTARQ